VDEEGNLLASTKQNEDIMQALTFKSFFFCIVTACITFLAT
jgi:hypothetical protein